MTRPARSVPAVLAAVLAMVASVLALASIVVSDIAEARGRGLEESDDVSVTTPVVMKKLQVKVEAPVDELDALAEPVKEPRKPTRKRITFGRFEGY
ncbi:MAG: hypothetical protein JNJ54_29975 [Myxococcaceae bacterium]|nr:hypothetical protein [Myxococcaceae bacterium]